MLKAKFQIIVVIFSILTITNISSAFQIRFNGADVTKDFSIVQVILGSLASQLSHEFGHYITAKHFDADPSIYFNKTMYHERMSKNERLWFYRGGYLGQFITGCILTAIPKTRGTDFTASFTGYSTFLQWKYAATGGTQSPSLSDTRGITENGGHGKLELASFGTASAYLTHLNLKQ